MGRRWRQCSPSPGEGRGRLLDSVVYVNGSSVSLQPFLNHELHQVSEPAAITPFIVVPAYQLEEAFVEFDVGTLIENGRIVRMNEIGTNYLIGGVIKNTFKIALAGFLHGRGNF